MPTAYKGKIRITCGNEACPKDRARADVGPECFICSAAHSEIIDLEDRLIIGIGQVTDSGQEVTRSPVKGARKKVNADAEE